MHRTWSYKITGHLAGWRTTLVPLRGQGLPVREAADAKVKP